MSLGVDLSLSPLFKRPLPPYRSKGKLSSSKSMSMVVSVDALSMADQILPEPINAIHAFGSPEITQKQAEYIAYLESQLVQAEQHRKLIENDLEEMRQEAQSSARARQSLSESLQAAEKQLRSFSDDSIASNLQETPLSTGNHPKAQKALFHNFRFTAGSLITPVTRVPRLLKRPRMSQGPEEVQALEFHPTTFRLEGANPIFSGMNGVTPESHSPKDANKFEDDSKSPRRADDQISSTKPSPEADWSHFGCILVFVALLNLVLPPTESIRCVVDYPVIL